LIINGVGYGHLGGKRIRGSILVDVEMGEQGNPALDHGQGLGDDDGAPPQSRCPMSLLSVVAFHGDGFASLPFGSPLPW
jgi:hypothetical protein